jgi:hypothetical protein
MGATLTSLTGLQNLTNLQEFRADWNSLTTVNLSGLSNLTYVDISDNDLPGSGTNSLTSLNVTGCTAIENLYLDDNDFSTGLPDLTPLTSLRILDLDQCSIAGDVDISQLSSTLENIDLSGNTGITSVILPEASLTNVDISNAALTQTAVNNILMWINGNGLENGNLRLHNGTSSNPSAEFLIHKTQLEGKGWNVNVNQAPPGYVGIAASTDFDIVGDFTIEMFVNMNNTDGYPRPYSFGTYPAPNAISIEGGTMYFWANEDSLLAGEYTPTIGSWNHIAVMGSGSAVYMYVDGVQVATNGYNPAAISSQALPLTIGYGNEPQSGFNGKMSNFRWSNAAMYPTAGFTVPTTPLTSTADTVLLTFQGTDLTAQLLDNSGNEHNATASGATYSASNPFTGVSGSLQMGNV